MECILNFSFFLRDSDLLIKSDVSVILFNTEGKFTLLNKGITESLDRCKRSKFCQHYLIIKHVISGYLLKIIYDLKYLFDCSILKN